MFMPTVCEDGIIYWKFEAFSKPICLELHSFAASQFEFIRTYPLILLLWRILFFYSFPAKVGTIETINFE
jgi:hypothetical protein